MSRWSGLMGQASILDENEDVGVHWTVVNSLGLLSTARAPVGEEDSAPPWPSCNGFNLWIINGSDLRPSEGSSFS